MNIWNWFLYHWIYCNEDETSAALNCTDTHYDNCHSTFNDLNCLNAVGSSYDINDDWWCNTSNDSSYTDWDSCYSPWDE